MNCLKGKRALVIGGAFGIGDAVARRFRANGASVCIADLAASLAEKPVLDERRLVCDVRVEEEVRHTIERTIELVGGLDILVNNAGVAGDGETFLELDWQSWDRIQDINVKGTAYGMKHALPHMIQNGHGRIINTASQLAHKASPLNSAYCASKAAVVALTASVAQEVSAHGVTINCVCPGPTDTRMWRSSDEVWRQAKIAQLPIGRVGTVEEIASAYVFLASDDAAFMIGQSVSPNGGDVMW